MSDFVFNQAGLDRIVAGPLHNEINRLARRTAVVAELNIFEIMTNPSIEPKVKHEMQSDHSAIVGLTDEGSVARYLDAKAGREYGAGTRGDWMRLALVDVFPD